jgi:hypothetical protein
MTPTEDYVEQWKQAEARRRAATTRAEKSAALDETVRIYYRAGWTVAEFLEISRRVTNELRGAPLSKDQEPRKRGSYVIDDQGRTWRRETKLWHHQQRRRHPSNEPLEPFEGRYVWSVLVDEYGPVWLVEAK